MGNWVSLIRLYICTSMCLCDCMCVFLYCCVPPFFQTTSKSHSCFRQLGKMKFRLNLMFLVEYLTFLFLSVFLRCCISITVPIKCHKHNISATISGTHNSLWFLVKLCAGWAYVSTMHLFDFSFSIADRCFIALPINCERQANNSAWHPVFWTGSLLVKMMMRIKLKVCLHIFILHIFTAWPRLLRAAMRSLQTYSYLTLVSCTRGYHMTSFWKLCDLNRKHGHGYPWDKYTY